MIRSDAVRDNHWYELNRLQPSHWCWSVLWFLFGSTWGSQLCSTAGIPADRVGWGCIGRSDAASWHGIVHSANACTASRSEFFGIQLTHHTQEPQGHRKCMNKTSSLAAWMSRCITWQTGCAQVYALVAAVTMYIFSVVAFYCFQHHSSKFDSVLSSFITMYQLLIGEGWHEVFFTPK